jgi:hypothetical protein
MLYSTLIYPRSERAASEMLATNPAEVKAAVLRMDPETGEAGVISIEKPVAFVAEGDGFRFDFAEGVPVLDAVVEWADGWAGGALDLVPDVGAALHHLKEHREHMEEVRALGGFADGVGCD